MMLMCAQSFKIFLEENGKLYPYRDVKLTRNRIMHVRWLLIKGCYTLYSGSVAGVTMEPSEWKPVPSNAFSNDTVTYLIVTKQALPVPPVVGEVLEVMECWGKALDGLWYNRVVDYLAYLCYNGFELNKQTILHHAIEFKVHLMLQHLEDDDVRFDTVMEDFNEWFEYTYHYGSTRCFLSLCEKSIAHVQALLTYLDGTMLLVNSPVVIPVTPPSVVSSGVKSAEVDGVCGTQFGRTKV